MLAPIVTAILPEIHSGKYLFQSQFVISFQKRSIPRVAQNESPKLGSYTRPRGSRSENRKAIPPSIDILERFFPPIMARYESMPIHIARRTGISNPTRRL